MTSIAIVCLLAQTRLAGDVMPRALAPHVGIARMAEIPDNRTKDRIQASMGLASDDPSVFFLDKVSERVIELNSARYRKLVRAWAKANRQLAARNN
jgi:hypothetical protein